MNSRRFYHIWICLLCLLPALVTAQTLTQYEYWFDDGFDNRITMGLSGTEKDVTAGLDTRSLGNGLHQFFLRLKQSDGMYSPITSQYFFKAQVEDRGALEYWFDDNRSGCKRIASHLASDGKSYVVNTTIDLTKISAGYHRLYYRFVNEDGSVCSATSMTPVVLHSKYNVEAADLKVTRYSVAVDDEAPLELDVPSPRNEIALPYTLDARRFSAGNHTLTTKFWNSVGVNVTDQSTFKVVAQETPSITLSATEKDGYVTLTYNTIPNDIHYVVGRRDASGKARKVYETYNSNYPNSFSVIDHPDEGSYTYHVKAVYTDSEGNKHGISTDDQPITIAAGIPTTEMGRIVGRVIFGTEEIDLISAIRKIYVEFSDGGEKVRVEPNGTFYREGVPLGSKLTLSIPDDDYYTYEKVDLEVTKDTQNEVQIIKATRRNDSNVQISNEDYDLMITSMITGIPNEFNFEVKNTTSTTWTGNINLIAIKKKDASKMKSLTENEISFASVKSYYTAGSTYVNKLHSGKTTNITIKVTDPPVITKDEYYIFYIVSIKDADLANKEKILACNAEGATNPKEVLLEPTVSGHDYSQFAEEKLNACVIDVLKTMKAFDKYGGPLESVLKEYEWAFREYERTHNADGFFGNLPDLLQLFSEDLKNAIKDVETFTDIVKDVNSFYSYLDNIKEFKNADDFQKFVILANAVFDYFGLPFASTYGFYLEIAKDCAYKLLDYMTELIKAELSQSFYDDAVTIKIKVKRTKNIADYILFESDYFSGEDVASQIKNVEVHLCESNNIVKSKNDGRWQKATYTAESRNNEPHAAILKRIKPSGESSHLMKTQRFWAEITWWNGRVSIVPLLYDDIVDYKWNGSSRMAPVITVTFQSGASSTWKMADKIKLIKGND